VERIRGNYLLVRAGSLAARGWIEKERLGLICPLKSR